MIRKAPLDIGGDPIEQRANFEKMLSARDRSPMTYAPPWGPGGVPVLNIEAGEASHDAGGAVVSRRLVRDRLPKNVRRH